MSLDFHNLLIRLSKAGVDFVVIGGFAGVIHGCTMVTQDVDICCDFSSGNLLRLQDAIADLHPVHRMTPQRIMLELTEEKCKGLKNLYLDTDLAQFDCVSYVQGIGNFEKIKAVSETVTIGNLKCRVLSIEAVILSKRSLGRESDSNALKELEAIKNMKDKKQNGK